jgi:hypothetical protein
VFEAVSDLTADALLAPLRPTLTVAAWTIAATVVSAGPLLGFIVSGERGNWTEPLGVASLVVEIALLAVSVTASRDLTFGSAQIVPTGGRPSPARRAPGRRDAR